MCQIYLFWKDWGIHVAKFVHFSRKIQKNLINVSSVDQRLQNSHIHWNWFCCFELYVKNFNNKLICYVVIWILVLGNNFSGLEKRRRLLLLPCEKILELHVTQLERSLCYSWNSVQELLLHMDRPVVEKLLLWTVLRMTQESSSEQSMKYFRKLRWYLFTF